jgi:hypothetical protein
MSYNNGKIYKLHCSNGYYYYGSTITSLAKRLYSHKQSSKKMTSKVYNEINKNGWDNVTIELIELCPCNNRIELRKRENFFIEKYKNDEHCLNTLNSYTSIETKNKQIKDRHLKNKEHRAEVTHNYYINNTDSIAEYNSKYYIDNKEKINKRHKHYLSLNEGNIKNQRKQFYDDNKERLCKEKRDKLLEQDPEEVRRRRKEYRDKNKDQINRLKRESYIKRKNKNPL